MSERITAATVEGHTCHGCIYQAEHGQRRALNLRMAEYRCDNCQRPLCRDHIRYESQGDWWLCAKCVAAYEIGAQRRGVALGDDANPAWEGFTPDSLAILMVALAIVGAIIRGATG